MGLAGQFGGVGRGFVGDLATQRGIAGEGVDVALFDAVEPQTEQQVFADQGAGLHARQR